MIISFLLDKIVYESDFIDFPELDLIILNNSALSKKPNLWKYSNSNDSTSKDFQNFLFDDSWPDLFSIKNLDIYIKEISKWLSLNKNKLEKKYNLFNLKYYILKLKLKKIFFHFKNFYFIT